MQRLVLCLVVSTVFFLQVPFSAADPGDLDTSFGSVGLVQTDIDSDGLDDIDALLWKPDGTIYAVGHTNVGSGNTTAVVAYQSDGSLDTGFDSDGKETYNISGDSDSPYDALLLDSGSLIIGGGTDVDVTGSEDLDFFLLKVKGNGNPDSNFGTSGLVTTSFGQPTDVITGLALQDDDKIVAAGTTSDISVPEGKYALARYNSDGTLDDSFGTDGKVEGNVTGFNFDSFFGIALQSDGKIVACGSAGDTSAPRQIPLVMRFNSDGSVDSSFGTDGAMTVNLGTGVNGGFFGCGLQSDSKIIAAGQTVGATDNDILVARFKADGSLDTDFGASSQGFEEFDIDNNSDDFGAGVLVQDDDKIVVVGTVDPAGGNSDMLAMRLNPDGSLDDNATFSGDGIEKINFPDNDDDSGSAVAIQDDGKLLIGGSAGVTIGTSGDFGLARLQSEEANLEISMIASASTVETGDDYDYEVTITNNGPDAVGGITVSGDVPAEISFDSASVDSGTISCSGTSTLSCLLSTLADGGSVVAAITVSADNTGDPVTLTLTVSAQVVDSDDSNNTATVDVKIESSSGGSSGGCSLIRH